MRMDLRLFIVCVFLLNGATNEKVDDVKVCVVADPKVKPNRVTKHCTELATSKKSPVTCAYAADRLECMRAVSRRDADFTVLEPEDLYFSTLWDDSAILVVSELRAIQEMPFKYGTVVVVRNGLNITGVDLRGRKFCHPGLESGSKWNDLFAQYLEERLAPRNCDPDITVFEDRIKTSANYFGSSCKAGPWIQDNDEDLRLKGDYSSMCAICQMGDCSNWEKYRGSAGSLLCLTDNVGDVLWAMYDDVKTYFKKLGPYDSVSPSDYSLLCEDGTLKSLDDPDPCFWLAMPWQVIAANRKSANSVQKIFHQFSDGENWQQKFMEVIETYLHFIVNLEVPKTPEDFLKNVPGYLSAVEMAQGNCKPKHTVKLCTSSPIEQSKCIWMSRAALSVAVQPPLECVEKANAMSCLESVSNGTSDVVVVQPDYALDATTKYGLTTLYHELPNREEDVYVLSALVNANSNIKSLSDLRGKRICFTGVHSVGWNSMLSRLHKRRLIHSGCTAGDLLSYFESVCVVRNDTADGLPVCCPSEKSSDSDEIKALKCLAQKGCDAAFVDQNTEYQMEDESEKQKIKAKSFSRVCETPVPQSCDWPWSYPSYIMINSHVTTVKFQEISSFLFKLGDLFGRKSKNDNKIMEIFGPFDGVKNVIFKDKSVSFAKIGHWSLKNDYQEVVDELGLCSGSSTSATIGSLCIISFLAVLIGCI